MRVVYEEKFEGGKFRPASRGVDYYSEIAGRLPSGWVFMHARSRLRGGGCGNDRKDAETINNDAAEIVCRRNDKAPNNQGFVV